MLGGYEVLVMRSMYELETAGEIFCSAHVFSQVVV